uniref:Uncharacterized protein n=1 Tax=Peronospora matthiolae TaxID=2874970 RepID=A0AAV1UAB9_9STRA
MITEYNETPERLEMANETVRSSELESDSFSSPLPDPVPEAADEGGKEEELDEGSGGADLGSFLEGVEGFNDNSREAERVMEESLDRELG